LANYFWQFAWSFFLLIIILGGLFFLARYFKNFRFGFKSRYLEVLDRMALTPKSGLILFKANGKYYLAGYGEQMISLIDRFETPPAELAGFSSELDLKLNQKFNEFVGKVKSGSK